MAQKRHKWRKCRKDGVDGADAHPMELLTDGTDGATYRWRADGESATYVRDCA